VSFTKRDKFGKFVDHHTTTVEEAAAFERDFNGDYYEGKEIDWPEYFDMIEEAGPYDDDYDGFNEEEDDCMCSDPCCPCSGIKRGVP